MHLGATLRPRGRGEGSSARARREGSAPSVMNEHGSPSLHPPTAVDRRMIPEGGCGREGNFGIVRILRANGADRGARDGWAEGAAGRGDEAVSVASAAARLEVGQGVSNICRFAQLQWDRGRMTVDTRLTRCTSRFTRLQWDRGRMTVDTFRSS